MSRTYKLAGTSVALTPFGGPLDEIDSELLADYGRAVGACGRLEYIVAVLVLHVNKAADDTKLYDKNPPLQHSYFLKLLQIWLTKHPKYASLFPPQRHDEFFEKLQEHAEMRNHLCHGLLESFDQQSDILTIRRIMRGGAKDTFSFRTVTLSRANLRLIGDLADYAARHLDVIAQAIFEEEPQQAPEAV